MNNCQQQTDATLLHSPGHKRPGARVRLFRGGIGRRSPAGPPSRQLARSPKAAIGSDRRSSGTLARPRAAEEEIELLLRRWAQAKAGEGCVVLISGEPGIGKSRLTETVQDRLGGEPHTRLRFFCSPHHQDNPLYPPIAQLERAAGFRREDTAEVRLTKLEALLAQATNDVSGVAPLFADLLSIPTGDRYLALNLTPQKRKEKTLQALVAQAEGLASRITARKKSRGAKSAPFVWITTCSAVSVFGLTRASEFGRSFVLSAATPFPYAWREFCVRWPLVSFGCTSGNAA